MDTGFGSPARASPSSLLRDPDFITRSRARAAGPDGQSGSPPSEDIVELAHAGMMLTPLPRAMGGRGWGTEAEGALDLLEALRLLGRVSLPLGRLYEGHVNAVRLVVRHALPEQCPAIRAALVEGQLFGVWNTETPEHGLRMEVGRLRGGKVLCSGIGVVRQALVTARPAGEDQPQMWLVPLQAFDARGDLSGWVASGMRASATGRIDLDGFPLDACLKLGGPGDYQAQPDFSGGAWRFLAVQLGGIEAIAEALKQHLRGTGRGEDPHQAARFASALTAAETARLWVRGACLMAELRQADPERVVAYVDLARGAVERSALDVMELAQRSVGLQAFMTTHPLERLVRDLATYLRQPAPDRALVNGARAGLAFEASVGDMWP